MNPSVLDVVGVAAWYACSLFSFWLAMRARPGREQKGRTLVGVGALFMATSLALPEKAASPLPAPVVAILVLGAGVALLLGLVLCFPQGGLTSVVRREKPAEEDEAPGSETDASDPDEDA